MTGIYIRDENTNQPVVDVLVEFFDAADNSAGWITDSNGYVVRSFCGITCF